MFKTIEKFLPKFIKKKILNYLNKNYLFVGWNLKTKTCPPWKNTITQNKILQISYFNDLNEKLIDKINKNDFLLNQKNNENSSKIYELSWRHYNVLLSLKYLMKLKKEKINLVEAGVADGLTAWFALNFLEKENIKYGNFTLIDSWEKMDPLLLKKNESKQIGRYSNNDIEITKKNLKNFKNTNFLKGFIPNVLEKYNKQNTIDWLHIDLNSSVATKEILEFFSEKLNKNSIIIFDDYGWPNHEETRIEIDKWSINKSGILWPLPTGQAIFFNS